VPGLLNKLEMFGKGEIEGLWAKEAKEICSYYVKSGA
jgi:hypothetical protein